LFFLEEEGPLGFSSSFLLLALLFEVFVVDLGIQFQTRNINFGVGGNHVGLVDTTEWNSVDHVGASDKEKARRELLEEDDSVGLVTSSQENEDFSRHQRSPQTSGTVFVLVGGDWVSGALLGVKSWGLLSHLSGLAFFAKGFGFQNSAVGCDGFELWFGSSSSSSGGGSSSTSSRGFLFFGVPGSWAFFEPAVFVTVGSRA